MTVIHGWRFARVRETRVPRAEFSSGPDIEPYAERNQFFGIRTMAKMAVTGGAGFIGSNLAEFLLDRGHHVVIVDNFTTGKEQNLTGWVDRAPDRIEVFRIDINETDRLRQAFAGTDYVFHQAAIPSVPRRICRTCTRFSDSGGVASWISSA